MPRTTDGTPRDSVDPATAWEGVFAEAKSFDDILANSADDAGSTANASDPGPVASQGTDDGLSSGASDSGSPLAPQTDAAGDDGASAHASQVVDPARDPAALGASAVSDATKAPDADPLAGTEPFTYTVGDQTKTMEGVFRVPGEGLYVPEDKVPHFQLIASRAETLDRQNLELYDKAQEWDRRSTWVVRDAQGKPQTLTGAAAFEAQRTDHAAALAQLKVYDTLFKDPNRLAELLVANQDADGNIVSFSLNEKEMRYLKGEQRDEITRVVGSAKAHLAKISAPPPTAAPDASAYAGPTITALIAEHKIVGLTPADIALYTTEFPRYVERDAVGRIVAVAPRFLELLQDRATMRGEQKKAADAAATTGKFNDGMNQGRKGPPAPVAPKPATSTVAPAASVPGRGVPKPRTTKSANDIWSELAAEAVQLAG